MPDRLGDKKQAKVADYYREHPLLKSCTQAFKRYQANMAPLLFAPEEVFCEAAIIIDHINGMPQSTEVQTYITDLWNELRIKLSKWEKNSSGKNLDMAVSAVLYTVAIAMERHWATFYNFDVTSWLLQAITNNMKVDIGEMSRVFNDLLNEADGIEEWINTSYDGHLSKEIEIVVNGKKSETKKANTRRGRKSIDPNTITASFSYLPTIEHRTERLQAFYHCLDKVFVEADMIDFIDMFQGKTTTKKIPWIRSIKELHYLIDHLEMWINWPKSYDKWQMTCARFLIRQKVKTNVDDSLTNDNYIDDSLKLAQFNKGGKIPQTYEELDKIIRILNPKYDLTQGLQDYLDFYDQNEHDNLEDYRDALANDLSIYSRL